jgi:hypothetical protein
MFARQVLPLKRGPKPTNPEIIPDRVVKLKDSRPGMVRISSDNNEEEFR